MVSTTSPPAVADEFPATPDRYSGLARGSIHLPEVLFLAIATMAPGVGTCFSLAAGAPFAGGALPGSTLLALLGCLFVAVAIASLAEQIPSAGGMATYIGRVFGGGMGFISGWGILLIYLLALSYLPLLSGDLLGSSFGGLFGLGYGAWAVIGAAGTLAATAALQYYGIRLGSRTGMLLGMIEILVVGGLAMTMAILAGDRNTVTVFWHNASPGTGYTTPVGMVAGSIYAVLAFIGFDAAAPLGEEAANPRKTVKRAVIGSTLLVGLFYVFAAYASDVYFGPEKYSKFMDYGNGNPWGAIASAIWGTPGKIVFLLALLNSSIACSNGCATAATRTLWAMGQAGTLPRWLATTHPRLKSPVGAIAAAIGLNVVLVLFFGLKFGAVMGYTWIGTAQGIGILPVYVLVAAACPVYFLSVRRAEFKLFSHLVWPALGIVCLVPAFIVGAGIPVFSFVTPLTYPLNYAGPAVGVFWVIGLGMMMYHYRRNPTQLAAMTVSYQGEHEAVPEAA
jgi:amino acid transporter